MIRNKFYFAIWGTLLLFFACAVFIGRYPQPYFMPLENLFTDKVAQLLLLNHRIPRIIAAVIFGAGLSVAGVCTQTLFRNPIADSSILGVSQAAAFGTIIGKLFQPQNWIIATITGIFFGLLSLFFVNSASCSDSKNSSEHKYAIIISGIATSAIFSSGIGLLKYLADSQNQLPDIVFWLMGGLWQINWNSIILTAPIILCIIIWLYLYRFRLNAIALPDEVAFSLGVDKKREMNLVLSLCVSIVTITVIFCGIISWVGLIVPNISRRLVGENTLHLLPFSAVIGASFLLICDTIARSILPGEIPVGILTSIFGAVLLILLITKKNRNVFV